MADSAAQHGDLRGRTVLWRTWLRIAAERERAAWDARRQLRTTSSGDEAHWIDVEFRAALVGQVSVAFGVEALDTELAMRLGRSYRDGVDQVHDSDTLNAGSWIAARLSTLAQLEAVRAALLRDALHWLFELRNDAVHFTSTWDDVGSQHPEGFRTTLEMAAHTADNLSTSLAIALRCLETIRPRAPQDVGVQLEHLVHEMTPNRPPEVGDRWRPDGLSLRW